MKDGYAYNPETGLIFMDSNKYFNNFIEMLPLLLLLLVGVGLVLYGVIRTLFSKTYIKGIWPVGVGVVFTVLALLLCVGLNNTAYYPSTADLQSSLTIENSSSSEFTLRTMFYVSFFIPFVIAYIAYVWHSLDRKKIDKDEMKDTENIY